MHEYGQKKSGRDHANMAALYKIERQPVNTKNKKMAVLHQLSQESWFY